MRCRHYHLYRKEESDLKYEDFYATEQAGPHYQSVKKSDWVDYSPL